MNPMITPTLLRLAASLLFTCGMVGCMPYKIDVVRFEPISSAKPANGSVPDIHIDTNFGIPGPFGGNVKSRKPYSIVIDHVDESFSIEAAEITKLVVTYHDGTTDPGIAALKLPLRVDARDHESVNSVSDSANPIVRTKMRLVLGKIPHVISRDEPITVFIEGGFIKNDGRAIPFTIRESYKPEFDRSTVSWVEAISSI
jgi:hypothetical protein